MQQCYNFAGIHKGTIIRIKPALNSAGSMVGIAWVTLCWGVIVSGLAMQMEVIAPLSNCTPSHPKHGILIFSASKNLV
jgi:hypothetical protein